MGIYKDQWPKLLIVDGTSVLSTCYYAALPPEMKNAKSEEEKEAMYGNLLQNSEGIYTNGILGMSRILVRFIEEWKPDYIAIAFDKSRNTFRRKQCESYKAQRGRTPQPLKDQIKLMEQILSESGIPVFVSDNFEADDIAGSIAEVYKQKMRVCFLTKDRDYLQLVDSSHDTTCFILSDQKKAGEFRERYGLPEPEFHCLKNIMEFNEELVLKEKGVRPKQIPDLKAMEGDASDNIAGVKGVSATTAIPLLKEYKSIEELYRVLEEIGEDEKKKKELARLWKEHLGIKRSPLKALAGGKEDAFTSKWLATIVRDIKIPDITPYPVKNIRTKVFNEWMERLEIRNINLEI